MRLHRFSGSVIRVPLSLAGTVLIWHVITTYKVFIFAQVPSPAEVFAEACRYVPTGEFAFHILTTNLRVLSGFLVASILGIPFGLMLGWKKVFEELTLPVIEILRPLPPIAWLPLSSLMFTSIEVSVLFLIFVSGFFPIAANTYQGVVSIPAMYRHSALSLGASPWVLLHRVILPGATPSIFAGLAAGMGLVWEMAVAAEMATGEHGLGYMTWDAFMLLIYPRIVLGMLSLGLCGCIYSVGLRVLGARLMPWRHLSR
jgi:NitT/TauT family transport system permease protein